MVNTFASQQNDARVHCPARQAFLMLHPVALVSPPSHFSINTKCFWMRRLPENQQRMGGFFLSLMPQMKSMYVAYCSNHPSAVNVLTQHR